MQYRRKQFEQHLYHEIEGEEEVIDEHLYNSFPLIGIIVMFFNGLEKSIDEKICEIISERSDSLGLIVIHKMSYSSKVDLFKRFSDEYHRCTRVVDSYDGLIANLKEAGRLRNLAIHADWESTDDDKYTYVNFKISASGMEQEYVQFSEDSLMEIIKLITETRKQLNKYWDETQDDD